MGLGIVIHKFITNVKHLKKSFARSVANWIPMEASVGTVHPVPYLRSHVPFVVQAVPEKGGHTVDG